MDELVKLVSQKLGLSEAVARQAVEIIVGFLKSKLPSPIASQLDAVLSGQAPKVDEGGLLKKLGGLLGGKK